MKFKNLLVPLVLLGWPTLSLGQTDAPADSQADNAPDGDREAESPPKTPDGPEAQKAPPSESAAPEVAAPGDDALGLEDEDDEAIEGGGVDIDALSGAKEGDAGSKSDAESDSVEVDIIEAALDDDEEEILAPEPETDSGVSAVPPTELTTRENAEPTRSGLWGMGIGLEIPMVGVLTGAGERGKVGTGYTLGGALSYEVLPEIAIRLFVLGGATNGGKAPISFEEAGVRTRTRQSADWLGVEAGLGAAYIFHQIGGGWLPYVGLDGGVAFSGYDYRFDDDTRRLEAPDLATNFQEGGHESLAFGFTAALRGGVRLDLTEWLSGVLDLRIAYQRVGNDNISNTLIQPDVRAVPENVLLFGTTFSVRLGL